MELYRSLPSTNYSWTTSSIESLRRLRGLKQCTLNQMIVARVELVRLVVFSAVECGVHIGAAGVKIAAAVIQLPLNPLFGGVTTRVALIDAGSHIARAVKLVVATPCAMLLGLAHPEWSIGLYQKFSLVKQPQGHFASAMDRLNLAAKACWALPRRNEALLGIATTAALVGGYFLRATRAHNPYMLLGLIGTAVAFGVSGLSIGAAAWHLRLRCASKTPSEPTRTIPAGDAPELVPISLLPTTPDRRVRSLSQSEERPNLNGDEESQGPVVESWLLPKGSRLVLSPLVLNILKDPITPIREPEGWMQAAVGYQSPQTPLLSTPQLSSLEPHALPLNSIPPSSPTPEGLVRFESVEGPLSQYFSPESPPTVLSQAVSKARSAPITLPPLTPPSSDQTFSSTNAGGAATPVAAKLECIRRLTRMQGNILTRRFLKAQKPTPLNFTVKWSEYNVENVNRAILLSQSGEGDQTMVKFLIGGEFRNFPLASCTNFVNCK